MSAPVIDIAPLQDALRLALPVFPCGPDKRPTTPNGFYNASSDPDGIRQLWRDHPGQLVGVPTGEASGLFVVDIDNGRHEESNDWLERHSPYLPDTRHHATKSGGVHLLFEHRAGLRNTASKLAKGVDTRGEGGYIIWWPFHLGLGAGHCFGPIAPLPDWMVEALLPPPVPKITLAFGKSIGEPNAKVQGILNKVAGVREGNRNGIFWGACCIRDMVATRELGSMEASQSLQALHNISLQTGLSAREIARTIQSAMVCR
jgi:Bifunctional DNA primase/polymerase, N-terminal